MSAAMRGGVGPEIGPEPVVFLDKDGTLIEDLPYNVDPRRVRFAPLAREAIRLWAEHGFRIAIVTNQSGVARGYFGLEDLDRLADHLRAEVHALNGRWGGFYACPHLPEGVNDFAIDCDCRKPEPGLIREAAKALGAEPERSWFVGDTWMDIAAGRAAGCRTILVAPTTASRAPETFDRHRPDHVVTNLLDAARIVVGDGTRELVGAAS